MATTQDTRTFKIFWKDQIRRFSGPDQLPWEEFLRQLRAILGPDFHQELRIQYVDDESDKIDLTTQMEWEQCLTLLPPGGLVKLYITPGSGIYFKDSAPPAAQYFYEEPKEKKPTAYNVFMKKEMAAIKVNNANLAHKEVFKLAASRWRTAPENIKNRAAEKKQTLQPNQVLQELSQVVPEVLGQCFSGNKILPYHIPDWLSSAVNIKPTHIPHEVGLDINIDGLFSALFDKAMSLMRASKFSFAREFWIKALSIKPQHATVLYNLACTEALLGNKRAALEHLRHAFEAGFSKPNHAANDADLESLRSDPEFQAILSASKQEVLTKIQIKTEVKEEPQEEEMEVEPQAVPAPVSEPVPTPATEILVPVPMVESKVEEPIPQPQPIPVQVSHPFAFQLANIRSMGFTLEEDLLVSLLVAYEGDVPKVVGHLLSV